MSQVRLFMWSEMLASVEVHLGLSIIISLGSSIFGSSRLMIIDRKTLQNCNLSAASWLALSRICPVVFTKLSHTSRGVHQCAELPVVRFPRQQRKCGPLAGLDGTVGTAGGHFRYLATPQSAYFPGFAQ